MTTVEKPFLQRYQTPIVILAVIALVVGVVAFVFLQASAPVYACSNIWEPTPAEVNPDQLGAVQPDMGTSHVGNGDFVRYTNCPPASGSHWNAPGGPITPRYYGPGDTTYPQGWVHNLEHGGLVILYACDQGGCDADEQAQLSALAQNFPNSPVCDVPAGINSPVITRFEQMAAPFAALVWDRVLLQDTLDVDAIKRFFAEEGERTNPELGCPRPSPSAEPSPSPSASPEASPSASPTAG